MLVRIRRITHSNELQEDDIKPDESPQSIGLQKKVQHFGAAYVLSCLTKFDKEAIPEIETLLQRAGLRDENAMENFMKVKFFAAIATVVIFFAMLVSNDSGMPIFLNLMISFLVGAVVGHRLTNMHLKTSAEKRKEMIENGIPDLIDLLVICTESGLSLNKAIERIAKELRTSNEILADELSLTAIELEMMPDQKQVFQNFEERTDCQGIRTLSKTFSQSVEYGSSLAVSLRDLAVESRQKRMLNAEARAAQAPALLTLPTMFFIMPCLLIVMIGPVIVDIINTFRRDPYAYEYDKDKREHEEANSNEPQKAY